MQSVPALVTANSQIKLTQKAPGSLVAQTGQTERDDSSSSKCSAHSRSLKLTGSSVTRRRLLRSDTRHLLVSQGAIEARAVLAELARAPRPVYKLWQAVVYGSFIDMAILVGCPIGSPLTRGIIRYGGPENLRFLLSLARFDSDGDGSIDDREFAAYEKAADALIADSITMCGNLALVSALLLGLTHQVTIGRPVPFVISSESREFFGDGADVVVWVSYAFNLMAEGLAFFTISLAVIARNALTNILPTRELRIDMLRTSNALGRQAISLLLTLWCFLISCMLMPLAASPTMGFLGLGWFLLIMLACMYFIAPLRYTSVMLLHEEIKRTMADSNRPSSFKAKRRSSTGGNLGQSVLGHMAVAAPAASSDWPPPAAAPAGDGGVTAPDVEPEVASRAPYAVQWSESSKPVSLTA